MAAGSGSRYGGQKQFESLGGTSVVGRSIRAAAAACDGVVVVITESVPPEVASELKTADAVVVGGATRSASVRNGLAAIPREVEIVVVHDAARPGASPALFDAVISAVRSGADAAVPGIAIPDTVKRIDGSADRRVVTETIPRADLVAVQTPQAFDAERLREAHASGLDATDDAGLVEQFGGVVVVVDGEPAAHKITTAGDLELVGRMLGIEA